MQKLQQKQGSHRRPNGYPGIGQAGSSVTSSGGPASAATSKPKRHGGEKRGNSYARRARKLWMLATWGDGTTCPCVHCQEPLDFATVEADRIIPGGSYRRDNVQPACRSCNLSRSDKLDWQPLVLKEAA